MCNNGCINILIINMKTFTNGTIVAKVKRPFSIYISIATDVVAFDKWNGFVSTNDVAVGIGHVYEIFTDGKKLLKYTF